MQQTNIFDIIAQQAKVFTSDEGLRPRFDGLYNLHQTLGEEAIVAVMQGLSRKIEPNEGDIRNLIDEWEMRDIRCCYDGEVKELVDNKSILIVAVSYKHAPMEEHERKGKNRISKMTEQDEELLVRSIIEMGKASKSQLGDEYKEVIIWHDQIISTKYNQIKSNVQWYNAGLLPYSVLSIIPLSTNIPDDDLEKRIWIRAERSLGRMGRGIFHFIHENKMSLCVGRTGTPEDIMASLAQTILSNYWPEDLGYWKDDYKDMKQWALHTCCRQKPFRRSSVFEEVQPLTDLETLSKMVNIAIIPSHLSYQEPATFTTDHAFNFKATAWNLNICDELKRDNKTINHYMPSMGDYYQFSWWTQEKSSHLFGCLVELRYALAIIALKTNEGYTVHRLKVSPQLYTHAEYRAGNKILEMISSCIDRIHEPVSKMEAWYLTYCRDERLTHPSEDMLKEKFDRRERSAHVILPPAYFFSIAHLFQAKVNCCPERNETEIANEFQEVIFEWNKYIKNNFDSVIEVRDTSNTLWFEGVDSKKVTFGLLQYITEKVFLNRAEFEENSIELPDKSTVTREIYRLAEHEKFDRKLFVEELFGCASGNASNVLSDIEISQFMLHGGFTSTMDSGQFTKFLTNVAKKRRYGITRIVSRNGEVQIRVYDESNKVRFMQRKSVCSNFTALGFIDPLNLDLARALAVEIEIEEADKFSPDWTTTQEICLVSQGILGEMFENSLRDMNGKSVLPLDMSSVFPDELDVNLVGTMEPKVTLSPHEIDALPEHLNFLRSAVTQNEEMIDSLLGTVQRKMNENQDEAK